MPPKKSLLALLPHDVSVEQLVAVAAAALLVLVLTVHALIYALAGLATATVVAAVTALLTVPDGDVLIHCGDFTDRGTHKEIKDFNDWLGTLPHRHKIVVAGNHDLSMDAAEYKLHWDSLWRHTEFNDPTVARDLLSNCTYLENRSTVIDGVKIHGSPMTPPIPGRIMAFNVERGYAAQQHWAKIPSDVDILITHGPPHGILDKTATGLRVGDESLLKEVVSRCRPQFHLFGHIHEAYGIARLGRTVFINCATSTLLRRPKHRPVVFDVPSKC
ncbi:hypothetical protein P43SY_003844 [Pythium insidiosum]|uniref:Calcineurin-like phosphoesterase domain-containing protein n=1 Tax=Pythium insidiosum TaxID=114742 RepID=A0AAD5LBY9_PYTIN|nr:hypothetical protein P43SY_003844 [Pythium insidiosum]